MRGQLRIFVFSASLLLYEYSPIRTTHLLHVHGLSFPSSFHQGVEDWLSESRVTFDRSKVKVGLNVNTVLPESSRVLDLYVAQNGTSNTNTNTNNTSNRTLALQLQLHLIPTPTSTDKFRCIPPCFKRDWTNHLASLKMENSSSSNIPSSKKVIHLHQDIWESKREIVQCRLLANLGFSRRVFARKTKAQKINATFAMDFLEQHHLWGATRAKHYYGLFLGPELMAVATFSNRRTILRGDDGVSHRSHELLRFCAQRDCNVVGGISKLIKNFVRDYAPDDLITVVDRDWGDGSGWHCLGFETVEILDPNVMVVNPDEFGTRRHLVGAGISHDNPNRGRLGLPPEILERLNQTKSAQSALKVLETHNFFPVYDSGVERLMKLIIQEQPHQQKRVRHNATYLWQSSEPKYASQYYSNNIGISYLLKYAAEPKPMTVRLSDNGKAAFLLKKESEHLESWRSSSRSTSTATILFAAPSSLDPTAIVEIRDRGNGWRTMGIQGGVTKSIYHSIYKVDPTTDLVEPSTVAIEYTKTMAAAFIGSLNPFTNTCKQSLRIAHFGLGAGTLMRLLACELLPDDAYQLAVEIDSGVVAAIKEISMPPNCEIREGDALAFNRVAADDKPFDAVFVDVFDEKNLHPPAFYSTEYLRHLRDDILGPSGVVVCNLHSGGKRRELCIHDAYQAYATVFQSCFLIDSIDSRPNGGNTILLGSPIPGLRIKDLSRKAIEVQQKHTLSFDLKARLVQSRDNC